MAYYEFGVTRKNETEEIARGQANLANIKKAREDGLRTANIESYRRDPVIKRLGIPNTPIVMTVAALALAGLVVLSSGRFFAKNPAELIPTKPTGFGDENIKEKEQTYRIEDYKVARGDTFYKIACRYMEPDEDARVEADEIAKLNDMSPGQMLPEGSTLILEVPLSKLGKFDILLLGLDDNGKPIVKRFGEEERGLGF